jgi:hypothetical protein
VNDDGQPCTLPVHEAPSLNARVIGARAAGDAVIAEEVSTDGAWLRVSCTLDTREGYELYDHERARQAWMCARDDEHAGELLMCEVVLDTLVNCEEIAIECS